MSGMYVGKRGVGRGRDYRAIKRWLGEQGVMLKQVAGDVGVNPTVVSQTIRGIVNNRKVLRRLLELGCPAGVLSLPSDLEEAPTAWASVE